MRVAIIGSQNTGKSRLIEDFIKQWPMYKKPQKSYRDIIKEKNIALNMQGNKESQQIILNALVDEIQLASTSENKHIIFDRCPIDNIAYSLWHHAKGTPGFTSDFIMDCKTIAALSLNHIDVLFYIPIRKEIPIVSKENRDLNESYRTEMDNIFSAMVTSYEKGSGAFFPKDDCPPVIRLDGPPDLRVPQMRLYIKDNGNSYGEEDGSLIDASNVSLD